MSPPLTVLLVLAMAGTPMASDTATTFSTAKPPRTPYVNPPQSRGFGDTIEQPYVIPGLGTYIGTTSGFIDDYDEVCPYEGSTSPDVVYAFTPASNLFVDVDLCASSYDTKLYIYEDVYDNLVGCSDDAMCGYSGWQSRIDALQVLTGHTYYIVIDGYSGDSGDYELVLRDAVAPPPSGSCCYADGSCEVMGQAACPGAWTLGGVCIPNTCPQPTGSCCEANGHCTVRTDEDCPDDWTMFGVCVPNPCPQPPGACCAITGPCTVTTEGMCSGTWTMGGDCIPNPCPQPTGSCCPLSGPCSVTTLIGCNGVWTMNGTCDPNPCPSAGPNAGGVLIVHDAGLEFSYGMPVPPFSLPPADCNAVDNELPLGPPAPSRGYVWKVYAAFPEGSSPRLHSVTWGIGLSSFGGGTVALMDWGLPDPVNDTEVVTEGWAYESGTGIVETFGGDAKLTAITELYWFAGYGSAGSGGEAQTFCIQPHPTEPSVFGDDSSPMRTDLIAGYGCLGFGMPGQTPYPAPLGECCHDDGSCTLTTQDGCDGAWTLGGDCDPNPCPQPAACCAPGGPCTLTLEADCDAPSVWHGDWLDCDPNPCQSCVSVVAGTPVPAGGTYTVPLSTPDALTLEPIYAFTIDVYIDPTFLTLTGVSTTGTMTEGNGLFAWREISPGLIRVTWGGVAALAGPGVFANLILEESAESPCGECTPLDVRDILFNEGEPCALAVDGEFCVPTYAMQGQVTYFSCDGLDPVPPNPRGIPGVQVTRVRDCGLGAVDTLEVTTDGSGAYTLQGCPDCQDCLTPSLARSADSTAISSWDATLILRYVLLVDPLNLCIEEAAVYDPTGLGGEAICPPPSGFEAGLQLGPEYPGDLSDFQILPQKVVADVSRNHSVTAYDASLILKYRVGDPMGMASRAGEWDFYCASRCYAPGAAVTTADFVGLLNGDVSGDWSSGGFRSEPSGPPIVVTESIEPQGNRLWLVSLGVTGADGYLSGDYRLTVRQSDWELVQVRPAPLAGNSLVEGRLSQDELRVAMAGAQPVGDGAVVWITLRSRSEQPGSMPELIWAQINDGSRPVVLESASGVPELEAALPAGATMRVEPNPVRGEARLTFRVTEPGSCLLEIFAPDGRVVRRLTEGTRPAGVHAVEWDGRGEQGTALPSGVYFARLRLGEVQVEQRVVILR